jgi:hypothetical protein
MFFTGAFLRWREDVAGARHIGMCCHIERRIATICSLSFWERAGGEGRDRLGQLRRSFDDQNHAVR